MKKVHILSSLVVLGLLIPACADDPAIPVSPLITGHVVDDQGLPVSGAAILVQYELLAPPPDKPLIDIHFIIPADGAVRLWITDPCTGEMLRTLLDEDLGLGTHDESWDGCDDDGLILTSGLYRVHLEFGGEIHTMDKALLHPSFPLDADPALYRRHATTSDFGGFSIGQTCLPFGQDVQLMDDLGVDLGTYTFSRRIQLYVLHKGFITTASPWVDVDPITGVDVEITLP